TASAIVRPSFSTTVPPPRSRLFPYTTLFRSVENSIGVITALNPHVGYKTATKVAKEALETGVPIRDIILKEGILSESAVDQILDSFEMTNPGISGSEMLIK